MMTIVTRVKLNDLDERVIIGMWQTRAEWEAWHADPVVTDLRAAA